MVNMGELFAHPRINNVDMERVPLSDDEAPKYLLEYGDLLFARQSLVLSGAGKCSIFLDTKEPTTFEGHLIRARVDFDYADPHFYYYFFGSPIGLQAIGSIVEQVAAAGIRGSDLSRLMVPYPPLPEQCAIAHILGTLDDKIELNRRMNQTLEGIARALFKSWFVDFDPVRAKAAGQQPAGLAPHIADLFPDEFVESDLGEIPRGWRIGVLEELLMLQRGFDLPTQNRIPGPYQVIAASGPSTYHNEAKVSGPGVVTGRSGVLGKVFLVQDDFWPLNTTLWVKEFRGSKPHHAYFLLQRLDFSTFNAGSAVPTLNRNHVHNLPVVLPDPKIIDCFESTAKLIFDKIRANDKQSNTLAALRDTLLPKLISGELRVPDAERIVGRYV